jgi:hypothetical protein
MIADNRDGKNVQPGGKKVFRLKTIGLLGTGRMLIWKAGRQGGMQGSRHSSEWFLDPFS